MKLAMILLKWLIAILCIGFAVWYLSTTDIWKRFFPDVTTGSNTVIQLDRAKIREIKELELLVLPYGDIKHQSYTNKDGKEVAHIDYMYSGLGQLTLDLEKVNWEEITNSYGQVTNLIVSLPEVKAGGARIFHHSPSETDEYKWVSGIIGDYEECKNVKIAELERAARDDAQKRIVEYIMRPDNVEAARRQAESILRVLLSGSANGNVQFKWPERPSQDVNML